VKLEVEKEDKAPLSLTTLKGATNQDDVEGNYNLWQKNLATSGGYVVNSDFFFVAVELNLNQLNVE
jgi:hypothetical protein